MNILFSIWTCLQPGVLGFEGVWVSGVSIRVCRKTLFFSDQFETPGELSLGMDG